MLYLHTIIIFNIPEINFQKDGHVKFIKNNSQQLTIEGYILIIIFTMKQTNLNNLNSNMYNS